LKPRLVLLGGSGFIGQSLLNYLATSQKRGRFESVILDPVPPRFAQPDFFAEGGIEETDKVADLIKEGDIVLHLVHTTIPSESADAPSRELKENLEPSIKLIQILKKKPVKGLIYFSSGGTIYGEPRGQEPIPESAPATPNSIYAQTKLKIEKEIIDAGRSAALNYIILRPANPYGPWQEVLNRHGAAGRIFQALWEGSEFEIFGDGETIRDYIYIDDLVEAVLLLLEKSAWNQTFNIGTGQGTSLNRLISLCQEVSGKTLRKKYLPLRSTDLRYNVLDASLLKALGWPPRYSLKRGLKKTWKYFLENKK